MSSSKWKTRKLRKARKVESRTTLVRIRLQLAETRFEGKPRRGKMRDDIHVTLCFKCAEQPSPSQ